MVPEEIAATAQQLWSEQSTKPPWSEKFTDIVTGHAAKAAGKTCYKSSFPDVSATESRAKDYYISGNWLYNNIRSPTQKKQGRVAEVFDRVFCHQLYRCAIV